MNFSIDVLQSLSLTRPYPANFQLRLQAELSIGGVQHVAILMLDQAVQRRCPSRLFLCACF